MTSEDVVELVTMEARTHSYPWNEAVLQQSIDAGHHCLVCNQPEENTLLAYAVVSNVLDEVNLLNICVDNAHQGQGIGKGLLSHIIHLEKKKGASCIFLEVRESNMTAQRLYESLGFIFQGVRKNYYPAKHGRENASLYSLSISSST